MTKTILAQLQLMSAAESQSLSRFPELPSMEGLSLSCTLNGHPSAWRDALAQSYLPWLWDLEPDTIAHKEASKPPEQEWNWELLVRQLAQVNIHEPGAVLEGLPMGLRNRRRIWRIVKDILSSKVDDYYTSQWHK